MKSARQGLFNVGSEAESDEGQGELGREATTGGSDIGDPLHRIPPIAVLRIAAIAYGIVPARTVERFSSYVIPPTPLDFRVLYF